MARRSDSQRLAATRCRLGSPYTRSSRRRLHAALCTALLVRAQGIRPELPLSEPDITRAPTRYRASGVSTRCPSVCASPTVAVLRDSQPNRGSRCAPRRRELDQLGPSFTGRPKAVSEAYRSFARVRPGLLFRIALLIPLSRDRSIHQAPAARVATKSVLLSDRRLEVWKSSKSLW